MNTLLLNVTGIINMPTKEKVYQNKPRRSVFRSLRMLTATCCYVVKGLDALVRDLRGYYGGDNPCNALPICSVSAYRHLTHMMYEHWA